MSTEGYLLCPQVGPHVRLLVVRLQVRGGYGAEVIKVRLDGASSFVMQGACPVLSAEDTLFGFGRHKREDLMEESWLVKQGWVCMSVCKCTSVRHISVHVFEPRDGVGG